MSHDISVFGNLEIYSSQLKWNEFLVTANHILDTLSFILIKRIVICSLTCIGKDALLQGNQGCRIVHVLELPLGQLILEKRRILLRSLEVIQKILSAVLDPIPMER